MTHLKREKRALEVKRLDLDAAKSKFKKIRSTDQPQASNVCIIDVINFHLMTCNRFHEYTPPESHTHSFLLTFHLSNSSFLYQNSSLSKLSKAILRPSGQRLG